MQLHELKIKHKLKRRKRIGRGGKRGTYSGRGIKGQRARAGRKLKPAIRELIKKYPKLRGYKFKSIAKGKHFKPAVLNLKILEKKFSSEEKVTPEILLERELIRRIKGRAPAVKILGDGKLNKSLTIQGCHVSKKAKEKIEKAGGTIHK